MQIQNHFTSYSGGKYAYSHSGHIPRSRMEEEQKKQEKSSGVSIKEETGKAEPGVSREYGTDIGKKRGFFREFWDSMGDSPESGKTEKIPGKEAADSITPNGISAAATALKQRISHYILNKWEAVREKIQVNVSASLKRFGKRKDTFTALSDPGRRFSGRRGEQRSSEKAVKGAGRAPGPEIRGAVMEDNHLLDSYSKKGEYCRLKDHL